MLDTEEKVLLILFREKILLKHLSGKGHTLSVRERSAGKYDGIDGGTLDAFDLKNNKAVVKKDVIAGSKLVMKVLIGYGNTGLIALYLVRCEGEGITVVELDLSVLECSDSR